MKSNLLIALLLLASGCEILEEDLSRDRVSVLAPADEVVLGAGNVMFRWQKLPHAVGYEFRAVSPSFDRAERIVADTVIRADSLGRSFGCALLLEAGDYQWSVTAFNGGYASRTEVRSLRIESSAPEMIGLPPNAEFPATVEFSATDEMPHGVTLLVR